MKQIQFSLAVGIGLLVCCNVHAALLRTEQIVGYGTGRLGGDSTLGSLNGWNFTSASITCTNGSGSLDGTSLGLVESAGDRVFLSAYTNATLSGARNQFVPSGTFPQSTETNIYYSFLYKFINAADVSPDGHYIAQVFRANSGINTPQHWMLLARNVGGQIQLGISKAGIPNNATNYASTMLAPGQTYFLVVRQHIIPDVQNDIDELWINPPAQTFGTNETSIPPSDASIGSNATDGSEDQSGTGPGRFVFYAGPSAELDELRIATTWAEVTPYLGQCVSAGIARSPASVSQSAELSATFDVVPTGTSPTIQWQISTDNGATFSDIPDAIASTYTTPNLSLADSGNQYRAIAHVLCDDSYATSEVATVTLTAPTPTPEGLIMDDTFLDPDWGFNSRNNPPLSITNSLWYTDSDESDPSQPGLYAYLQGGNLLGRPRPGGSSLWLGYFVASNDVVHLDVGRAIKVTLPFTPDSFASHTNNAGLRMGLFDYFDSGTRITQDGSDVSGSRGAATGVRGYMLNLDFGPTFSVNSPLQLLGRTFLPDINLMGTVNDYLSFGSGPAGGGFSNAPAFQAGTQYTLEFTAARTAVNTVDVTASITGGATNWTWSITDTNLAYHRFDSFAIRPNSLGTSADTFTFPDFKVEVIEAAIPILPFNVSGQLLSPGVVALTWDSVSGVNYNVLSRDSLSSGSWTTNATLIATGSTTSYTNSAIPTGVSERYYQVQATR